jgi:tRNA wybutosine-synthesizing protein 2
MKFKNKIKERLKDAIDEVELSLLPRGFQTLGNVIILKLHEKLLDKEHEIARAYLDLLPKIRSIYINRGKIRGTFREPEKIELLEGEDNPIVEHKEHEVRYKFDITKIMFSKGNINERKYLATLVKNDEIIVDMFAGIGYFSLPIAKHSMVKQIYCIELNPESYKFLVENIKINHLNDKIVSIEGNSKIEVLKLSKAGIRADRVIMGVFPAPKNYIKEALSLVKDNGTMFHYEGVVENEDFEILFQEFNGIASKEGFNCELISHRSVKSYGPHLFHAVLDIHVSSKIS